MTGSFGPLFRVELRRLLTPVGMAVPFLMLIVTGFLTVMEMQFSSIARAPNMVMNIISNFLIVFAVPLIGAGMVAADVKEHWLRTLLMRPVSRTEYLLARLSAVYVLVLATILIAGMLPIMVVPAVMDKPVVWMISRTVPALVFLLGHAYLVLVLMTLLSCWLPGIVNVAVLGVWALTSMGLGAIVKFKYWDVGWMVVATEFLFPSGFLDAATLAARYEGDPMSSAMWGMSSAVVATALAFWSVNRVQVDGGSE